MTEHHLMLPYSYEMSVLPSKRHRIIRDVNVRDYVDVAIQDVQIAAAPIVIRGRSYGSLVEIRSWNGRLYQAAGERGSDVLLSPREFEQAVSGSGDTVRYYKSGHHHHDPLCGAYPGRRVRWGQMASYPLQAARLETHIDCGNWQLDRIDLKNTQLLERADAQEFLAEAVICIDGVIHVACEEPVWYVSVRDGDAPAASVHLYRHPGIAPPREFRLDRLDEALAWAATQAEAVHPPEPLDILAPGACERDDEWCIAQWLVNGYPHLEPLYGDPEDDRNWLVHQLSKTRAEGGPVRREDVEVLLDALSIFVQAADDNGGLTTGSYSTDANLRAAKGRWEVAQEAGRGSGYRNPLDQSDVDALLGLYTNGPHN